MATEEVVMAVGVEADVVTVRIKDLDQVLALNLDLIVGKANGTTNGTTNGIINGIINGINRGMRQIQIGITSGTNNGMRQTRTGITNGTTAIGINSGMRQ